MRNVKSCCSGPLTAMKQMWEEASTKKRAAIVTLVVLTALVGIALAILYSGHFSHLMNTKVPLLGKAFTVGQLLGYSTAALAGLTILGVGVGATVAKRERIKENLECLIIYLLWA